MKIIRLLVLCTALAALPLNAQHRHHGHGHRPHKHQHRHHHHHGYHPLPAKVIYHAPWNPAISFHQRWVFFPSEGMYWDNYHGHFWYRHKGVWVKKRFHPKAHARLHKQKHIELDSRHNGDHEVYRKPR